MTRLNYDAWLHWRVTVACPLHCDYCFQRGSKRPPQAPPIKIRPMMRTLDKTRKVFKIVFTGGEPFMVPNFVEACQALTEKHYIGLNTNLCDEKINEFIGVIDPQKVLFLNASFHLDQLEKAGWLDRFVRNFRLCEKKDFPISASIVAYPPVLKKIERVRLFQDKHKISFILKPFHGLFGNKEYPDAYTKNQLSALGLDKNKKIKRWLFGQICNAGYNAATVLPDGRVISCYLSKTCLGNIYEKIEFRDSLGLCPFKKCDCSFALLDRTLFKKALYSQRQK